VLDAAWPKRLPGVERLVRKAARAAIGPRARSVTVALADDRRLRALNRRDRGKDKPTNVLSYPSDGKAGDKSFLGDVVLARQTVWREAKTQGKTPREHLMHLVVHGTLHLLGYDHETSAADARRMEALERRILAGLGIADPYAAR
jgi:probable rRNA maturation factor